MKVKELIGFLQKENPELDVLVNGYEGGVNDLFALEKINYNRDEHKEWYYGRHAEDEEGKFKGLLLKGCS